MRIESGMDRLVRRVFEREEQPQRKRAHWRPAVDCRTPRRPACTTWGAWKLDPERCVLVHAGAHVEVDLAQVLDPGELWRLVAAAQGEVVPDPADLVAALVAILPAAVVVRPNRLSVFEVEALAQSLAAGRRPAFTVRRPACVRDIDATAATAKEG